MRLQPFASLAFVLLVAGCPGGPAAPVPDLAMSAPDLASQPPDLAVTPDLASTPDLTVPPDMTRPPDMAQETCDALEQRYLRLAMGAAAMACTSSAQCKLLTGHCGIGLGGCYYAVNSTTSQADLDAIAALWKPLGCDAGRPVCRCAQPPPVGCNANACELMF